MNGLTPIPATYDYRLVVLSVVVAIVASYAALDLAGRVSANRGRSRLIWLLGGAFAMGTGIWSMHYTGMLAYRLPIRVYYHVPTVILSLVAAVLASGTALYVVSREHKTPFHLGAGSLLMGSGIAAMHYTGMDAMRLAAMHHYQRGLWLLSIVLAVLISLIGLILIFYSRDKNSWRLKLGVAFVIGLAIPVMHYTGMAAATFTAVPTAPDLSWSVDVSELANSAIVVVTFVILGFVIITSLVDRRLSAQQLLLDEDRKMLRALIDNIPDFMYVKDRQGSFVIANTHTARALGADSVEGVLGKTNFDFFPRELANIFDADEQHVIRTAQPLFNREEKSIDHRGRAIHLLTTTVPLRDANGLVSGIAGVGRDITERKKNEEDLRSAHREAEIFINAVPSILIGVNHNSQVTRWNSAAAAAFGLSGREALGKPLADCGIKWLRPDMPEEIQSWCSELGSRRCDVVPFERNGETRLLGLTITAVRISDGNPTELLVIGSDITVRSAMEVQLRQAQKLESVGQLAAGIAHEINTPTQYIGDNVRFLKDSFGDLTVILASCGKLFTGDKIVSSSETFQQITDAVKAADIPFLLDEIPKALDQALDGVARISTIVGAMKEFSHPDTKDKVPLDLNHAIRNTLTVARSEWKYVADLNTELDPTLPPIPCLPGQFNQVMLNLIVNAAHAIADAAAGGGPEKGTITVRTRNIGGWAEISIQDTGTGIPDKVRPRIFEPFFTTKEIGKGTGQGLAIARSVVVDKHNGTIDFETEEGKGTTFIVRLPHDAQSLAAKAVSV